MGWGGAGWGGGGEDGVGLLWSGGEGRGEGGAGWGSCIATARAGQTMQGYNSRDRVCIATASAGRLCMGTAAQRQRQSMHRDGESTADFFTLRQSNGSEMSCITTAAAAELRQRYSRGESRADCASLWREQRRRIATHRMRCPRRHAYSVAAFALTCDALLLLPSQCFFSAI